MFISLRMNAACSGFRCGSKVRMRAEAVQGRIGGDFVARLLPGEASDRLGEDGIAIARIADAGLIHVSFLCLFLPRVAG
jgi:hypothetical protein